MEKIDEMIRKGEIKMSDSPKCKVCGRRFFCRRHSYIYKKWMEGIKRGLKK